MSAGRLPGMVARGHLAIGRRPRRRNGPETHVHPRDLQLPPLGQRAHARVRIARVNPQHLRKEVIPMQQALTALACVQIGAVVAFVAFALVFVGGGSEDGPQANRNEE